MEVWALWKRGRERVGAVRRGHPGGQGCCWRLPLRKGEKGTLQEGLYEQAGEAQLVLALRQGPELETGARGRGHAGVWGVTVKIGR